MADAATRTPARRPRLKPELLSLADLARLLGIGVSTAERLKAAGRIGPRPVHLAGPKYRRREVLAWLARPGPDNELLTACEWAPVWKQLQADARRKPR